MARRAAAAALAALIATVIFVRRRRRAAEAPQRRAKAAFLARAGLRYGYAASPAGHIDSWRSRELPGLVGPVGSEAIYETMVYLDYAGSALPIASQLAALAVDGARRVLGNPHSTGPAASAASAELDRAGALVLARMCGSHAPDWECVWTSGATAALRLVAETFPFEEGSSLLLPESCHTSVLGMRGPASTRGARCLCAENAAAYAPLAADASAGCASSTRRINHLAVAPAECNLTGDVTDATAVAAALAALNGGSDGGSSRWWLMLDGAKAAASGRLDLPASGAAFCCVSFYKLFGSPTGLGALLVRRDALRLLRKDARRGYFGGGSVAAALPRQVEAPANASLNGAAGADSGCASAGPGSSTLGPQVRSGNTPDCTEDARSGCTHII